MFVPMKLTFASGETQTALYDRQIELTTRQLSAFQHEAGDMTVPLTAVGRDLRASVEAAFGSQGSSGATGKWTQLSDNPAGHGYSSWKQSHVPGVPILVGLRRKGVKGQRPQEYESSGEMRKQLLEPTATYVSPRRLLYAPLSDIAGYHETGTPDMPPRPPVDVSLPFLHSIDRTFARWLAEVIRKTGL